MIATSLHNRRDLAKFLNKNTPQLACDYYIEISSSLLPISKEQILVTSFTIPDSGINFAPDAALGHQSPSLNFSQLTISYIIPNTGKSPIDSLYDSQFNDGVPLFIPIDNLPWLRIYKITPNRKIGAQIVNALTASSEILQKLNKAENDCDVLMDLEGCRFSRPTPQISLSSDQAVVYTVNVSFENFKIY